MASRIEIITTTTHAPAHVLLQRLKKDFAIKEVRIHDVYTIDKKFDPHTLSKIAQLLHNPVIQKTLIDKIPRLYDFDWAIEIGFLPGVTDNVGKTARETIEDFTKKPFQNQENVYSSTVIFLAGKITQDDIIKIKNMLFNSLVQRACIKNKKEFSRDHGMDTVIPRVAFKKKPEIAHINLDIPDDKLELLGTAGITNPDGTTRGPLALSLPSMKAIQTYFKKLGRSPTDIEIESLAQTWSEHCKHTIFANPFDEFGNGLYQTYIQGATKKIREQKGKNDFCISVFKDNSGVIKFDEQYAITHKVETHNSPSALDPYGGALTGICGVNRDTIGTGLGAKPIANQYNFCFAEPDFSSLFYRDKQLTQPTLSSERIIEGVIKGINSGGNCSGIPTVHGSVFFDNSYCGKPLVFAGAIGLLPLKTQTKSAVHKAAQVGDYIVMVGGRVGADGIHGATFSSTIFDSNSPATAVQIGDPITQKKLSDALVKEARGQDLFNSITDNGAGGLSCSVAEMARECGGFKVQLNLVPLKYPGLEPWQIWISESQERMTLAVPPSRWPLFTRLMKKRGVEATIIGEFTKEQKCIVTFNQQIIMNVDMEFLHEGLPKTPLNSSYTPPTHQEVLLKEPADYNKTVCDMLSQYNIASTTFINNQYDYEVQGSSVIKPVQGKGRVSGDASVIRPLPTSSKGVVVSSALYPSYSEIDTYHMASCAIDSAIARAVSVGADPNHLALLDNFCWASSNNPEQLYKLKRAVQACYDYSIYYQTPFISGKDSMFNDFKGYTSQADPIKISALPTVLISTLAVTPDINRVVTLDVKMPGDILYVLGDTYDELGGSEYYRFCSKRDDKKYIGNNVPKVNAHKNKKLYIALYYAIQNGLIVSAQHVGRGGLAVALAKKALGGMWGIDVTLDKLLTTASRTDFALFSESQGRVLVTIAPDKTIQFEERMNAVSCTRIGMVREDKRFIIRCKTENPVIDISLVKLQYAYHTPFKKYETCAFEFITAEHISINTSKPNVLVLAGYGLNCEEETKYAFELAGGNADIIHVNDMIDKPSQLANYQVLAIPGGFSYGDDTGSGNAYANKLRNHLWEKIRQFTLSDKLVIGICNGFQILTNLGLVPAFNKNYGQRLVALTHNDNARYTVRWVDLKVNAKSPWLKNLTQLSLPIAHGEGKFIAQKNTLLRLQKNQLIALTYEQGEISRHLYLPANPNGSLANIAGITDITGRILGMMPHPERALFFTQLPHWTYIKETYIRHNKPIPQYADGLAIFQNAISYFAK